MLSRMSPEHKFATAARLCQEVLGGVADGGLPLSDASVAGESFIYNLLLSIGGR